MKSCLHCGETKPLDQFYADRAAKDGRRPECKVCTAARRKRWYAANREREIERVVRWQQENREHYNANLRAWRAANREKLRAGHLKRKFGLTLDDYDRLLRKQRGRCAICNRRFRTATLHVDHDHRTGVVRGLLCVSCNNALGAFQERPEVLQRAIRYLLKYAEAERAPAPARIGSPTDE